MNDDEPTVDWHVEQLDVARDEVQAAVNRYAAELARQREADEPIVVGWVVALEYTSVSLEQSDQAAREVIVPVTQSISMAAGLGAFLASRWV